MRDRNLDHYIRLFRYLPFEKVGEAMEITLEEVADVLCCTSRNGNLILKKMQELNWIAWVPGRGRGNRSTLAFQVGLSDLLFSKACELVRNGDISGANALVAEGAEAVPEIRDRFFIWLQSHFGHRVEGQGARRVDTLRTYFHKPFLMLDPAHAYLRSECHMVKQVFDCLVRFNPETQVVEPHVAFAWEADADEREWTFYLRKGVMFHHGRALTARDVMYTLERMRDPQTGSPYRWMVERVQTIEVLDELSVKVTLAEPNRLFLQMLSHERLSIVPQDYVEDIGAGFARLPVGTGPFKAVRNDESMLVLEAFELYFRERVFLDRVEMWIVPEWDGQVDDAGEKRYDMRYQGRASSETGAWKRTAKAEWSVQMLTFNIAKEGPLQDLVFREALCLILNPAQMVAEVGGPRFGPASGLVPGREAVAESEVSEQQILDLMGQSEYRGEVLTLSTFPDDDHMEDAEWIRQQCARFGILIEVQAVPVQELTQVERIREVDLILDGATVDENVEMCLLDLYLTENSFLKNHLGAELLSFVEECVAAMLASSSAQERLHIAEVIDRRLVEEQVILPLYRNEARVLSQPELHGVQLNSQGWIDYRSVWFKKKL